MSILLLCTHICRLDVSRHAWLKSPQRSMKSRCGAFSNPTDADDKQKQREHVNADNYLMQRKRRLLATVTIGILTGFGSTLGTTFFVLGAKWSCIFPYMMSFMCAIGVVHMLATKTDNWVVPILCYGCTLSALGVQWGFGVSSSNFQFLSPFLGPQLAITLRDSQKLATGLTLVIVIALLTMQMVELTHGAEFLTPQHVVFPHVWRTILQVMNAFVPGLIGLGNTYFMWSILKAQQADLRSTIGDAEVICKVLFFSPTDIPQDDTLLLCLDKLTTLYAFIRAQTRDLSL